MDIQRICTKFYASNGQNFDQETLIPVFQDWIKTRALNEVMIDIGDYNLVPNGPGIMLICHETNYHMDGAEGGLLGLLAQRKQPQEGDHKARILGVIKGSLNVIRLLKQDKRVPSELQFELGAFEYIANDRLLVSNDDKGLANVKADLEAAAAVLYPGQPIKIERRTNHPKSRLAVRVDSGHKIADADVLLQRL